MKLIKGNNQLFLALTTTVILCAASANAQTYKTAADTVKLNKEYAGVQKDIADLKTKLDKANGKTSDYQEKVTSTSQDANNAAEASKNQAATATNGNIKDIEKEEKKAKKANSEANNEKNAQKEVKSNQKEIKKLNSDLDKKQKRLTELDTMRASISSTPAVNTGTTPNN